MVLYAYYLLKVIACSAILFGYYLLALRNKKFHQYNRFYLVLSVLLSWTIPLFAFEFWAEPENVRQTGFKILTAVTRADVAITTSVQQADPPGLTAVVFSLFAIISGCFFIWFALGVVKIAKLIKRNPKETWRHITFVFTSENGVPFSFFKYIFWDKDIDINSSEGKHMLQHELVHVDEKHSWDKLFVNLLLTVGWLNPFTWLIRSELNMIHEFIADNKTCAKSDINAFAQMLLKATYPRHTFPLSNSFFYSPIKRRLAMLNNLSKPRFSYIRRLMILPVAALAVVFFSFKVKEHRSPEMVLSKDAFVSAPTNTSSAVSPVGTGEKEIAPQTDDVINEVNQTGDKPTVDQSDTPSIKNLMVVVNGGAMMSYAEFERLELKATDIKQMNVLKGDDAIKRYGNKAANGVMEIFTIDNVPVEVTQQMQFSPTHETATPPGQQTSSLTWPVDNGVITTGFGPKPIAQTKFINISDGLYISTKVGAKAKATKDGVVASVFKLNDTYAVVINHGSFFSTYSNLSSASVTKGEVVTAGEQLGYIAAGDNDEGELFFMLSDTNGKPFNPAAMLTAR